MQKRVVPLHRKNLELIEYIMYVIWLIKRQLLSGEYTQQYGTGICRFTTSGDEHLEMILGARIKYVQVSLSVY